MSADAFEAFEEVGLHNEVSFWGMGGWGRPPQSPKPITTTTNAPHKPHNNNQAKVQEVGRRFRRTVLALGGGSHPSEVYEGKFTVLFGVGGRWMGGPILYVCIHMDAPMFSDLSQPQSHYK